MLCQLDYLNRDIVPNVEREVRRQRNLWQTQMRAWVLIVRGTGYLEG